MLSLRKNRLKEDEKVKANRSSDVILLDESFDILKSNFPKTVSMVITSIFFVTKVLFCSFNSTSSKARTDL